MNNARLERTRVSSRALLAFAALVGVGGLAVTTIAVWPDNEPEAVTEVETVRADEPVTTIAPIESGDDTVVTEADDSGPEPGDASPSESDSASGISAEQVGAPLSPLAELLGPRGSAVPPEIEPRVKPASIKIDGLDLWGPVRAVGLEENGELEVPDETEIGWYQYGATPGNPGATVLAAHVTWNGTVGPFFRLGDMNPGDTIDVALEDGSTRTYAVTERTMYDKDELPRERIWRNTGDETLVLITCGGSFNPEIRRYRDNIVVYAVPVDQTPAPVT